MTALHIFKMEMFKYTKDKKYIIMTAVLAVINVCLTVYFTFLLDNFNDMMDSISNVFAGFMMVFLMLTIFANMIFMFLYPFHLMAMDYKNNVMSMLVASGVNRTRLFFAKIGATLIWSLCLTLVLIFIPASIILFKASQMVGFTQIFDSIMSGFNMVGMSTIGFILSSIISYINSLVLIAASAIIMKGRNLSIFLFIGLSMLQSFFTGIFAIIPSLMDFSMTGLMIFNHLLLIIATLIFIVISLNVMKRQNL